jgi:hypothetical protein
MYDRGMKEVLGGVFYEDKILLVFAAGAAYGCGSTKGGGPKNE